MSDIGDCLSLLPMQALSFALEAHGDQRRKYTNERYINHPMRVAATMAQWGIRQPEVIAAAILHDVIEDTEATHRDLLVFGSKVADTVLELSNVATLEDGNRLARFEKNLAHLAKASPDAQDIKLGDILDNARDIAKNDPKFAKVYLPEKLMQLQVLTRSRADLWTHVDSVVKTLMFCHAIRPMTVRA